LFKQIVNINGRCVRWVDSKNTLILQNLTIPPQVAKFRQQINAYVDSFGPGARLNSNLPRLPRRRLTFLLYDAA